jgi:hypothetical protein
MPFINGRFYMNPAYGRALERARDEENKDLFASRLLPMMEGPEAGPDGEWDEDWSAEARHPQGQYVLMQASQHGRAARPARGRGTDQSLANIVYNETGSLRADPRAKPGAPGSGEDLARARQATAEIANRVRAKHPHWVAPSTLTDKAAAAVHADAHAVDAYGKARTAADAALNGSNISNGAKQYRTRVGTDVRTPLGRSKTNPGTPVSEHYGPFIEGKHRVVVVVAK